MIEPAYRWVPPRVGSYGDEALDLARLARPPDLWPDEEQCAAVDAMLSYGPGGRWLALESVLIEPRQNGKTDQVLLPVTLFDLYMLPPDRIMWTAHLFSTARDSFDAFCACVEHSPELSRRTKKISYSHGKEYILTTAGAKLEFLAREHGGGRGKGAKRVVFDEALILSSSSVGTLIPTLSARGDPQVLYGSSAAKRTSSQLHRLIKRGRAGGDRSLIYLEYRADGSWSKPSCDKGPDCPHVVGVDGCAFDDEAQWRKANHAMRHGRITAEYLRGERDALDPLEFGRERLGWEEEAEGESSIIDMARWADWLDVGSASASPVALSVDVHPERRWAAIGMTGKRTDGLRHWQILAHGPGMSWALAKVLELDAELANCGWFVDPDSPAGALIPEMEQAGLTVHRVSSRDKSAATAAVLEAALGGAGRHLGQAELDRAWRDARTKDTPDGVVLTRRKSTGDITCVMAVALSDHGFRLLEPASYDPLESFL